VVIRECRFETARLRVREWHSQGADQGAAGDLATVVTSLLTPPVTRSLPPAWQGEYTRERAEAWVVDRDAEGTTLLASERVSSTAIGLMILFEEAVVGALGVDVRLGYVLAESAWGRGYGSEIVEGFVRWCRDRAEIRTLIAGVAADNPASIRILEKSGFKRIDDGEADPGAELTFETRLHEP
jgi:ribosomal-protein-alanine N-acetyltransferase